MIQHQELCELIPHSFDMCLLDRVEFYDENSIVCYSQSHQLEENPLQRQQLLSSVHLLEYAAQAMAVHGGIQNREQGIEMNEGYLAALRNVKIELCNLKKITDDLRIEATKIMAQAGNMIYNFSVSSKNSKLVSGRATVVAVSRNTEN